MHRGLVVCVLAAACGGDSGGGGPIPIESLQASAKAYECNEAVRCGFVSDLLTCGKLRIGTISIGSVTISADLIAAVEAGVVTYDGAAAGECLAALTATCDRSLLGSNRNSPLACDQVFAGTLPANAACALDAECMSGLCSSTSCTTTGMPVGTCYAGTPTARPALGDSCSSNFRCLDSYCDTGATYTCLAYLAQGSPCTSNDQCQVGLACRTGATSRTCQPLAAVGGTCTSDMDCRSIGNFCGATSTCTAYALAGDPCTTGGECSQFYTCDSTSGACVLRPTLGDSCSQQSCIDTSYCDPMTATCTAPAPDGATCSASAQCQSNHCDFSTGVSTCQTPPLCY